MIAVVDLIAWAKENAWGRSATVPDGWIPSELMQNLVYEIKKVEPLHYNPQTDGLIELKVEPIADTPQIERSEYEDRR